MNYLTLAMLTACMIVAASEEPDLSLFSRIMTDDNAGPGETGIYILSVGQKPLLKQLHLPCRPETLKQAMLEYEMGAFPYDSMLKKIVTDPKHAWGTLKIRVNGTTVVETGAGPYVTRGWHRLPLSPGVLKKGENMIEFIRSDRIGASDYFYFAFDQTAEEKTIMKKTPPGKRPLPQRQLHIRLLIQ